MSLVPIHSCIFEIKPAGELPPGKVCHITEHEGEILVQYAEGHLKKGLCKQLNTYHALFFEKNLWLQNWDEGVDRLNPPEDVPHGVAEARYVFVDDEALPKAFMCFPVEGDKEFIWLIRRGEMSEQGRQEMNAYLAVVIGRGLFVQQRP